MEEVTLSQPDNSKPFMMDCDASDRALGAALMQEQDGKLRPIAFLSRQFKDTETQYAIHKKETLAIVYAVANALSRMDDVDVRS